MRKGRAMRRCDGSACRAGTAARGSADTRGPPPRWLSGSEPWFGAAASRVCFDAALRVGAVRVGDEGAGSVPAVGQR